MANYIDVDGTEYCNTTHRYSGPIRFSLISAPPKREQLSEFHACRDFVNNDMLEEWRKINRNKQSSMDINKLRLLIYSGDVTTVVNEAFKKKLYFGKKIINFYEGLTKWKSKSTIGRVNHNPYGKSNIYLLTGPKQWMRSSNLVSMITLILRACTNANFEIPKKDITTTNEVIELWKKNITTINSINNNVDFKEYLPDCYDKFHILMQYYNEIFGKLTEKELFPQTDDDFSEFKSWHSGGGIVSLCNLKTCTKALNESFDKVLKKLNMNSKKE